MCNFCTMEELDSCKLIDALWLEKNDDDEFLLTSELTTNSGEGVREIATRIRFCPVCGKELK